MNEIMTTAPNRVVMTSREIADRTGKRHADVMRDIRIMMDSLKQNADLRSVCISSTYVGENDQIYPQYELDKDTCLTLLLGYDPVARMKVVKRWQELEAQQSSEIEIAGFPAISIQRMRWAVRSGAYRLISGMPALNARSASPSSHAKKGGAV